MIEWISAREIEKLRLPGLPKTKRGIQLKAQSENWAMREVAATGGNRREFSIKSLPLQARVALIKKFGLATKTNTTSKTKVRAELKIEDAWRIYEIRPQKAKNEAVRRVEAINKWESLIGSFISKKEADMIIADEYEVHLSTIRRWRGKIKNAHRSDWLAILVPQHAGRQVYEKILPELWEPFKADYLRLEKPTASAVYDRVKRIAKAKGIKKIASLKTFMRKLKRDLSREAITLARDGRDALDKSYPPQERDHSVFHALEALNADGYTFKHFVKWEDGTITRPCGWFNHDVLSAKLLNWRLDVTENRDLIRLALGDLVEQFGIPSHYYIDNTRAAANKWLTGRVKNRYRWKIKDSDPLGILPQLGIETYFTMPAHGQSKPVERAFGIGGLSEIIDKHPGFSGRGAQKKPIPIAEFEKVLRREIAHYNAKTGRRSPVCQGRSFDEVFSESFAKSEIRKVTDQQRRLLLLAAEGVTVNRTNAHVRLYGGPQGDNRYWSPKLSQYAGQKIILRFDPAKLHELVHAYTLGGKYICEVPCHHPAGFADTNAAREHAKNKVRYRKATRKVLEAERRMTALEVSKLLPDDEPPEPPENKVIQVMFGKPSRMLANETPSDDVNFDEALAKGLEILKRQKQEERIF